MKKQLDMRIVSYFSNVIFPIIAVSVISIAIAITAKHFLGNGIWQSLTEIAICLVTSGLATFLLGMTKTEKKHFIETVVKHLKRK